MGDGKFVTMKQLFAMFIAPVYCLAVAGCGQAGNAADSAARTYKGISPSSTVSIRFVNGDYDNDDYENDHGDADNDDSHKPKDHDNDSDSSGHSYFDRDDSSALGFGRAASARDRQAIATLVKRYYALSVSADGAAACSMIAAPLVRAIPEDLGRAPGPRYYRGRTCAAVMSKVFQVNRRALIAHARELEVSAVRVAGTSGLAVMSFKNLPGREIRLVRESGGWKLDALLESELP